MRWPACIAVLAALALDSAACGSPRELSTPDASAPAGTCTSCHGDASRSPSSIAAAPPRDTRGQTSSSAVGAHLRHLTGGAVRGPLECAVCHVVPQDAAHASQPLDLTWGALARSGATTPSWTAGTLTCSNYCHGASLSGGTDSTPAWDAGPGAAACGSCHGLPPARGHVAVAGTGTIRCRTCHPGTVTAEGSIDVAGGKHIDGAVQAAGGGGCTSCHGDASRSPSSIAAAPPRDTRGQTSSSAVGAHLRHLTGGAVRGPLECAACHVVPQDAAHASQPLDLTWGALARSGATTPSWTAETLTCSNYCHGASLSGGGDPTPEWDGGPGAAACGTCHGLPPARGHVAVAGTGTIRCRTCHPGTVTADGRIDVGGGKHVDGEVQATGGGGGGGCTSCHGDDTSVAPPRDTTGGTTGVRVGAHRAHVAGRTFSDGVGGGSSCPECHGATPTSTAHSDGQIQIGWGPIAAASGRPDINGDAANPTKLTPGATATCTNSCHQVRDWKGTRSGGTRSSWSWTDPAPACNACHGTFWSPLPPTGKHQTHAAIDCSLCHGAGYSGLLRSVAKSTHVDGAVQVSVPGWSRNGNGGMGSCGSVACHEEHGAPSWWGGGEGGGGDD